MESFNECLKLAKGGEKQWCYKVGEFYEQGNEVEQSYDKAFEWYKKGAQLRSYASLLIHREENYKIKKEEYENLVDYTYRLALRYFTGDGVKQTFKEAIRLFEICSTSLDKSDSVYESRVYLGMIYEYGLGVEQNYIKAAEYYLGSIVKYSNPWKVVRRPLFIRALSRLGYLYEHGLGVNTCKTEAFLWYKKASYIRYLSMAF